MKRDSRYSVKLIKHGIDGKQFGWRIHKGDNEIDRSTTPFNTRFEALIDSARAAGSLIFSDRVETSPIDVSRQRLMPAACAACVGSIAVGR